MTTKPKIEFDPDRLSVLDQKRRSAQALQRAANDQLHDLRDKKNEARRMADMLHRKSLDGDNEARKSAEKQAREHEAEAAKLAKQMGEIEAEMSAHGSAAARANTLFKNALAFAVSEGLEIPSAFEGEADSIRMKGARVQ